MKYSIIVPVYNRPDEVDELLQSLCEQTIKDFEVIIVEDGSINPCKDVCNKYAGILSLHYYAKENSGPGQSRNYGAERANGEYVIILDSDVVLPQGYLQAVDNALSSLHSPLSSEIVAFGGPDAAHPDFTPVQKAISYAMTSFFTTGGIRGGKAKLDKFYPRSFNMGIRRDVYQQLGGFTKMRFGEDIDFSYRIVEAGYKPRLFPDAWVWHKRRTDFRVIGLILISAVGRALMHYVDRDQFYWMCFAPWIPILLYSLLICIDSSIKNKSLYVGLLSVPAAFVQLMGYGLGFIESWWKRCILKQDEFQAFERTFYK